MKTALFILFCFAGVALGQPASIFQGVNQIVAAGGGGGGLAVFSATTNRTASNTTSHTLTLTGLPANTTLLSFAGTELANESVACTNNQSLTFVLVTNTQAATIGTIGTFVARFAAGGSITVTNTFGNAGHNDGCLVAITGAEAVWAGSRAETQSASGSPTLSITPRDTSSIIFAGNTDWNARAGTITYVPAGSTQLEGWQDANFSFYVWYKVATAGANTFGMSSPTLQAYGLNAVEIRQ